MFMDNSHQYVQDRFDKDLQKEFVLISFGVRSGVCIGMQTEYVEAFYVIGALLQQLEITRHDDFSMIMRAHVTLDLTNGLLVSIRKISACG